MTPLRPDKRVLRPLGALLPRGLFARTLLILLLPMVILQGVALQLFYGGHLDVISRRLAGALAGDVSYVAELLTQMPDESHPLILREGNFRLGLALSWEPGREFAGPAQRAPWMSFLPLERDLDQALREQMPHPFDADWHSDPQSIVIRVGLPTGLLSVEAPRKRLLSTTLYVFVIWLVGSALLAGAVAVLFLKNQVRAIRRLATAAEDFGLGRESGPIKPEGAREVRQAALAFNHMQERILRFVSQRTEMLAGISHDLRTPLTRMRLTLAMLPPDPQTEEDLAALSEDVEEMERLVETYLAFARGEGTEQARDTNLSTLVAEVAEKARRAGAQVEVQAPEHLSLRLRGDALKRALGNLLDNARRHAERIAVAVSEAREAGRAWAEITVDDDGPGIPAAQRNEAFRPFASGSATGTGLGLAIARDIVRAHGGEILLEESPMRGLRARIRLPV
ncbi:ATP-binding protein [Sabulicella rubraurantiaca]|uniref:ATP-binding protein n=1 Tax=Sabulicella rubraurantiaca TaxID=2811429 RepID=UPI002E28E3A7|nr:ATP-binding protein [Sabulicella rubraurantiaca]